MAVAIPRSLADPEHSVILRNGASVRVRAIRADDEPRLLALCRRLSSRTLYQRFFSLRRLRPEEAHAFANVDYHRQMAVVAEVDDGQEPELVGVARYGPSDEGTADIGLVVADAWQGLGLGSLLLEAALDRLWMLAAPDPQRSSSHTEIATPLAKSSPRATEAPASVTPTFESTNTGG